MNLDWDQLTLFPPDTLASHSVMPGSEKARKMTATSGRKYAEYSKNSGLVGLLVKMLLGTSLWGSTMFLMTWGGADYSAQPFVIPAAAIGAGHKRDRVLVVAHSDSRESQERMQRRIGEDKEEVRSGMDHRFTGSGEDSESMADSASRGFGETRGGVGRPEEWITRCSSNVADSEGIASRGLPIREGETNAGLECGCEDVAYTSGRRYESQEEQIRTGWNGIKYSNARTTQPGMGGSLDEFSAWMDEGLNPLDALIDFITYYPQPALLGQHQYDWEPPRVATGIEDRAARLKALGNAVNPLQALPIFYAIRVIDEWMMKGDYNGSPSI